MLLFLFNYLQVMFSYWPRWRWCILTVTLVCSGSHFMAVCWQKSFLCP